MDTKPDKNPSLSGTNKVIGTKPIPKNIATKANISGYAIEPKTPKTPQK